MFGLSPYKILLLIVVIGVVFWFFRRAHVRARDPDERLNRNQRTAGGRPTKAAKGAKPIEDMAQCRVCNAYVAAKGASRCGRDNCPF
jgi:hypothetical protein